MRVSDRHRLPSPPLAGCGAWWDQEGGCYVTRRDALAGEPPRMRSRPLGLQRCAALLRSARGAAGGRAGGVCAQEGGGNCSGRSPWGVRPSPRRLPGALGRDPEPRWGRGAGSAGGGEPLGAVTPRGGCGPRRGFHARPSGGDRACPRAALRRAWRRCPCGRAVLRGPVQLPRPGVVVEKSKVILETEISRGECKVRRERCEIS